MKIRNDYTCPLEIVHDIIKGKWKTILLYQMKNGPKGLSELEHEIEGINQKMLLEQLRELIQFGLVEKKTFEGYPLRVEYSITERRGRKMIEAITIMQMIGVDYMLEKGMTETLIEKGILTKDEILSFDRMYEEHNVEKDRGEIDGTACGGYAKINNQSGFI